MGTCRPRALLFTVGSGVGGGSFLLVPRGVEGVDRAIWGNSGSGRVGEGRMGVNCPVDGPIRMGGAPMKAGPKSGDKGNQSMMGSESVDTPALQ